MKCEIYERQSYKWLTLMAKMTHTQIIFSALILRRSPHLLFHGKNRHHHGRTPSNFCPYQMHFCLLHSFFLFISVTKASLSPPSLIPSHVLQTHYLSDHYSIQQTCNQCYYGPGTSWSEQDPILIILFHNFTSYFQFF